MTWISAFAWGGVVGWRSGGDVSWAIGGSVIGGLLLGSLYGVIGLPPGGRGAWGFLMALTLHVLFAVLAAMVVFYQLGR